MEVLACLYKCEQIEKTCIHFVVESGLRATLIAQPHKLCKARFGSNKFIFRVHTGSPG